MAPQPSFLRQLLNKTIFKSKEKGKKANRGKASQGEKLGEELGRQITLSHPQGWKSNPAEAETLHALKSKFDSLDLGPETKLHREKTRSNTPASKRRAYMRKKQAMPPGLFNTNANEEESHKLGKVFGIPLAQVISNEGGRGGSIGKCSSGLATIEVDPSGRVRRPVNQSGRNSLWAVFESPGMKTKLNNTATDDSKGGTVPAFVQSCRTFIENKGLHTVGIFRVSPSLKRLRQLREDVDTGTEITFGEEHSPHDVAALLKEFLRDLPEPIIAPEIYTALLYSQRSPTRRLRLDAIRCLLQMLPATNRDTLGVLLEMFATVAAHATDKTTPTGEILPGNKMNVANLATIIAPDIMGGRALIGSMDANSCRERNESIDVIDFMITNHNELFGAKTDAVNKIYTKTVENTSESLDILLKEKAGTEASLDCENGEGNVFKDTKLGEPWEGEVCGSRRAQRQEDILPRGGRPRGSSDKTRRSSSARVRNRRTSIQIRKLEKQSGEERNPLESQSNIEWIRRGRQCKDTEITWNSATCEAGKRFPENAALKKMKRACSLDSMKFKSGSSKVAAPHDYSIRID